jgi:hypothetical protein
MKNYVVEAWHASPEANSDGYYIAIQGRFDGFLFWILSLLGISPKIIVEVSADRLSITEGSWSGVRTQLTPLKNVSSTGYGCFRPFPQAIILASVLTVVLSYLLGAIIRYDYHVWGNVVGFLLGLGAGVYYYLVNRQIAVTFTQISGHVSVVTFKQAFLGGKRVSEVEVKYVCELVKTLIENALEAKAILSSSTPVAAKA